MKATFKYGIATYSGTIDEMTYAKYNNGRVCIARKYVVPKLTNNNLELGSVASNLSSLYASISEEFKGDLRTYAYLYGKQKSAKGKLAPNCYSIYTKMMYAFGEKNSGSVDLKTITFSDINSLYPEICTLASAVEEGYLPNVTGANLLVASM